MIVVGKDSEERNRQCYYCAPDDFHYLVYRIENPTRLENMSKDMGFV